VKVTLNGADRDVAEGATLADVLTELGLSPTGRGVAVAVGAEVVPRGEWPSRRLAGGERVEVLTASQGG
jgi:sulfur carrier protein